MHETARELRLVSWASAASSYITSEDVEALQIVSYPAASHCFGTNCCQRFYLTLLSTNRFKWYFTPNRSVSSQFLSYRIHPHSILSTLGTKQIIVSKNFSWWLPTHYKFLCNLNFQVYQHSVVAVILIEWQKMIRLHHFVTIILRLLKERKNFESITYSPHLDRFISFRQKKKYTWVSVVGGTDQLVERLARSSLQWEGFGSIILQ